MNKVYAILIICFLGILMTQTSFAKANSSINKSLYNKAETSLKKGDTLEACAIYRSLKTEIDSISQINYQNEVKAKRTVYQIDELYLENKIQEGIILKRVCCFLLIIVLLLTVTFYYLHISNRKLEQARMKAQQLKEKAELSTQNKTKLLYAITKDMTESLTEMRGIAASLQRTDVTSPKEVRNYLSYLRSSTEKLQRIYNQIFS